MGVHLTVESDEHESDGPPSPTRLAAVGIAIVMLVSMSSAAISMVRPDETGAVAAGRVRHDELREFIDPIG